MQKHFAGYFYIAAVVGLALSASAQREGPYLTADIGGAFVQDLAGTFAGVPGKLEFDPGVRAGIGVGYTLRATPSYEAAVQFESGVIYNSINRFRSDFGDASADGDMYQVPILADILYTFSAGPRLVPYVGIGGGGVYSRVHIESMEGFFVGDTSDSFDPAVQALVGVRYKLDERNEIGLGYKFLAAFAEETIQTHAVSLTYVLRF